MDEIYCRLVTKNALASELNISVRSLERHITAGDYMVVRENVRRVWVVIESEATPERLTKLGEQNDDLMDRINNLELSLSSCQDRYAKAEEEHTAARARVTNLERYTDRLTEEIAYFAKEAEMAETEAASARQKAAQLEASFKRMTDDHKRELADRQQDLGNDIQAAINSGQALFDLAARSAKARHERQLVTRTWVGMLIGAGACVSASGALTFGVSLGQWLGL